MDVTALQHLSNSLIDPAKKARDETNGQTFLELLTTNDTAATDAPNAIEPIGEVELGLDTETDLNYIREHGFAKYAADIQAQLFERIRDELLGELGLTEDELNAMPPDQRAAIERSIEEQIQQRLAAINPEETLRDQMYGSASPAIQEQTRLAEYGPQGFGTGNALLLAMEMRDAEL